MDLIDEVDYKPFTVFMPSDVIMASLPQEQKDFLFHQDNQRQLLEYLKYHVLISQKVRVVPGTAEHLEHGPEDIGWNTEKRKSRIKENKNYIKKYDVYQEYTSGSTRTISTRRPSI